LVAVSALAPAAAATYASSADTMFSPVVNIAVPGFDDDADGVNDFVGASLLVGFEPAAGSDAGCSGSASGTWQVDSNGAVVLTGGAVVLVDRPAGSAARCEYTAGFPGSATGGDLVRTSAELVTVNATVAAVAAYASSADTMFSPVVSFAVPNFDDDADGVNDFTGASLVVVFEPAANSDSGCTGSASGTWQVDSSGNVPQVDSNGDALGRDEGVRLVDRLAGSAGRCEYNVRFPGSATGGDLVRTSAELGTVSATAAATAVYSNSLTTMFVPAVTIEVFGFEDAEDAGDAGDADDAGNAEDADNSDDFEPTTIMVSFIPLVNPGGGCSSGLSETWRVDSSGEVNQLGMAISLVDRPAGELSRCSYNVVFPNTGANGELARASAEFVAITAAAPTVIATYGLFEIEDITFLDVGSNRISVEVSIGVSGDKDQKFAVWEDFEVLVSSPGNCGMDELLFGGVSAEQGVIYSVPANVARLTVLGDGLPGRASRPGELTIRSTKTNPAAEYTLPGFVVNDEREIVPCVIRVVELEAPYGCVASSAKTDRDAQDRSFVEATWDQSVAVLDVSLEYDCAASASTMSLTQGWHILPFNGPTGLSPLNFAASLNYAISSVWRWDVATQSWQGWSAAKAGDQGFGTLRQGETVMVYAPRTRTVQYSPSNLITPADPAETLTLPPGYSLHIFNGNSPAAMTTLVGDTQVIAYRWDAAAQRYHNTDLLQPGDAVLLYNPEPVAVLIDLN